LPASKLVVLGESAGGNLAAVTCLLARERGGPEIRLQVLVYPAVDARQECESLRTFETGYLQTTRDVAYAYKTYGVGQRVAASDWRVSPLLAQSHAGLPPALIISAECDGTRDDSDAYAHALLEAGVPAVHVRYGGMVHTFFGMRGLVDEAAEAQRQVAAAMRAAVAN
jgi:acetyl esterase